MPAGSSRVSRPTSRRNSPSAWASCSSRSRSTLPTAASRRSQRRGRHHLPRAHARARGADRFRSGLHGNGDDLIVPGASPIATLEQADQPGRKIVAYERTAVEEMLKKKMTKATIVRVPIFGYKQAFELIEVRRGRRLRRLARCPPVLSAGASGLAYPARQLRQQRARDRLCQGSAVTPPSSSTSPGR